MPLVSVVLPSYNRLRTLPRAIASVLAQTVRDLELIIVDDGSTDGTREYLRGLEDPRLKVIELSQNKGAAGARNVGVGEAVGEYIAFQDSDDEWLVTFLEKQIARLETVPEEFGVSYCGKAIYGRDENRRFGKRRIAYMPDLKRTIVEGDIYLEVLKNALVSTQTFVARLALIKQVGGFNEGLRIGIDWELSTRLAQITKYTYIDEPLVMTFISDDSLTLNVGKSIKTIETILENNREAFAAHGDLHAGKLVHLARVLQVTGRSAESYKYIFRAIRLRPLSIIGYKALVQGLISPLRSK